MENAKFDPIIKSRSTTADQLEALYNHEELTIEQIAKVIRHPNVDIDFVEELLIFEREEDYQVIMAITGKAARLSREAVEKLMYIIIYNHPHEWSKEDLKKLFNRLKQCAAKREDAPYNYPWLKMTFEQFIDEYECGDREIFTNDEDYV